jgi:hypothetical protein
MTKLVIGTTNPAKVRQCELALRDEGFALVPIIDVLPEPPDVLEDAWSAEKNAARKAREYARVTNRAALSLDFALFFDDVAREEQPGVNVRRIPGAEGRASDEELISHYARLFASRGGRVQGGGKPERPSRLRRVDSSRRASSSSGCSSRSRARSATWATRSRHSSSPPTGATSAS